jgi:hypothetical protein
MDNKNLRGPADASRINLSEEYEVRYWTEKFGCSREQLADAVQKVGSSAAAVEVELGVRD